VDKQSGLSTSANVTIKLKDKNDNPPVFGAANFTVNVLETAPANTRVITVKVCLHSVLL